MPLFRRNDYKKVNSGINPGDEADLILQQMTEETQDQVNKAITPELVEAKLIQPNHPMQQQIQPTQTFKYQPSLVGINSDLSNVLNSYMMKLQKDLDDVKQKLFELEQEIKSVYRITLNYK